MRRTSLVVFSLLFVVGFLILVGAAAPKPASGPSGEYLGLGANRTVFGSMHLVTLDGDRVLLDAGTFKPKSGQVENKIDAATLASIKAVVVTHAHTDHCGRLIQLAAQGLSAPIFVSSPTRELLPEMLAMSARFSDFGQEKFTVSGRKGKTGGTAHSDPNCPRALKIQPDNRHQAAGTRAELEKRGFRLCRECIKREISRVMEKVQVAPLREDFRISPRITARFLLTPHLPGSVMVRLKGDQSGSTLLYTGDFGSGYSPFLPPQDPAPAADWAIVEGTSGPPNPQTREVTSRDSFQKMIGKAVKTGKRVAIAAFALDRTQQVLWELSRGLESGVIPKGTPVRLFSPSAERINDVYFRFYSTSSFSPWFSDAFRRKGPFSASAVSTGVHIKDVKHGEIAVGASGTGKYAASREFLERWIEDPKTVFIFVSYLDPDTPGGMLATMKKGPQGKVINLGGKKRPVKAQIHRFRSFTGHAPFEKISSYLKTVKGLKTVFLVHLEAKEAEALRNAHAKALPGVRFVVPEAGKPYPAP